MKTFTTIVASFTLTLALASVLPQSEAAKYVAPASSKPQTPALEIVGARRGQAATIEWAVGRYASAGLRLPALVVEVHADRSGCSGERGLYRGGSGQDRIDLCTDVMYVLLHELAHAWEVNFASDDARAQFAASVGLSEWRSDDVAWGDQASERAANSVAWGLLPRLLDSFDVSANADLVDRFEALTGVHSPRIPVVG